MPATQPEPRLSPEACGMPHSRPLGAEPGSEGQGGRPGQLPPDPRKQEIKAIRSRRRQFSGFPPHRGGRSHPACSPSPSAH